MIKNIIFITTLALSICSQLYSMENPIQESPDLFTIQTNDYNLRFRRIDLNNLNQQDSQTLKEDNDDSDAAASMLGTELAALLEAIYTVAPEIITKFYAHLYGELEERMQSNQKIEYHWIIENTINNDFVGNLSISTYVDDRPEIYVDSLMLEIGLGVAKNYRNKKGASTLGIPALQKLATWAPFNDGIFCFGTREGNEAANRLAKNIGAELAHSYDKEIDFGLLKQDLPTDLELPEAIDLGLLTKQHLPAVLFVIPKNITHVL